MGSFIKTKLKKSQGFEAWFFVVVALLAFALFFVVMNKVWGEVKDPLQDGLNSAIDPTDTSSISLINNTLTNTTDAGLQFDKLIPFLVIGLFGFIMISAGAIVRSPVMIFVGIIVLGVVILIAVVFSNVYNNITESDEFSTTKAQMPIQDLFMHYLPVIVMIMAVAVFVMIVLSRSRGGGL